MSNPHISRIRIYPIKACAGVDLQVAEIGERGLRYDRRWMLVNEQGSDLHQFDYPRLASVVVAVEGEELLVEAPSMPALRLPLEPERREELDVSWFEGQARVVTASAEADRWFQEFLRAPCRLVYMPDGASHAVDPLYARHQERAGFTSFQYHLLGEASLQDLNGRLAAPVPMERFRPNLVIAGSSAFAEDSWRAIQIGEQVFYHARSCDRCAIITVDPVAGVMTGKEPLSTLARYRTFEKKVLFGQYFLAQGSGTLRVGDQLRVIEVREPELALSRS